MQWCGICGSDLRQYRQTTRPVQHWGHELVGHVAAVEGVAGRQLLGARVAAHTSRPCRSCPACTAADPVRCTGWTYHEVGGFAEYAAVPVALLETLESDVTEVDVLVEPLFVARDLVARTGLNGTSQNGAGPVLLLGIGPIGLLVLYWLRAQGVQEVYAAHRGRRAACAELAASWGATMLNLAELAARAGTLKCAAAVVTAPYQTIPLAVPAMGRGGRIVYNGISQPAQVTLDLNDLQVRRISLVPSFPHPQADFAEAYAALRADRARLAAVISHRVPLSEAPRAFQLIDRRPDAVVKVVLGAG